MPDATVPHRPSRRRAGRLLAALLLAAGLTLPAAAVLPSPAADAGTACDGVTVRVERPGSTRDRCAPGTPEDGLDALAKAGFARTDVSGQPGFVCTIDGYPDPCNGAPPEAYWSYWHAEAGATTWTYATRGGANRTPPPGTHDAWVFGDGSPPSVPPPARSEPSPAPSPSPSPTSDGSGSSGGSEGSSGGSGSTGSTGSSGASGSSGGSGGSSGDVGSGGASTDSTSTPPVGTSSADGSDGDDTPRSATGGTEAEDATPGGSEDVDASADGRDDDDDTEEADGADGADGADDDRPTDTDGTEDARLRPEALDDAVTVEAPGGGRPAAGAAAGALLVLGLGAAGLLRSRGRRGDLDGEV